MSNLIKCLFIAFFLCLANSGCSDSSTGPASLSSADISFCSNSEGSGNIFLMDTNNGGIRVLSDMAGQEHYPEWSPDGSTIAFIHSSDTTDLVYTVDPYGGYPDILLERSSKKIHMLRWSNQGSKIAVVYNYAYDDVDYHTLFQWIYLMNADGSITGSITSLHTTISAILWSHNDERLILNTADGIISVDLDGENKVVLAGANEDVSHIDLSPNDSKVYFSHYKGLGSVNVDGSDLNVFDLGHGFEYPAVSPDGSTIAFTRYGDIFIINTDFTSEEKVFDTKGLAGAPMWSPDGERLIFEIKFEREGGGHTYDIAFCNVNTKEYNILVESTEFNYRQPVWNPVSY